MKHTYRFNRPVSLLFLLPMLFLLVMLVAGLVREFSILPFLLALFTLGVLGSVLYFGMLRRLEASEAGLIWRSPGTELRMELKNIRHFGIVKYRSFRFIYLSQQETAPFEKVDTRIVPTEDTFVIQYRERAWVHLQALVQAENSDLKPESIVRS